MLSMPVRLRIRLERANDTLSYWKDGDLTVPLSIRHTTLIESGTQLATLILIPRYGPPLRFRRARPWNVRRHRPQRSQEPGPLHQPRVGLARVQPACVGPGLRRVAPAARARQVPRHHRREPRRVLHDPPCDHAAENP